MEEKFEQFVMPGFESLLENKEDFFKEGAPTKDYFDATELPDAPQYQTNAIGSGGVFILHLIFPKQEDMIRGIVALTKGKRKSLPKSSRLATINSMAVMPDSEKTFLEFWEEVCGGQNANSDAVQQMEDDIS